jgi:Protein of unknown function (DUF3800)
MLMHQNSESPEKETAALRIYLDESGGNDPNTPHAILAGLLIERRAFLPFEDAWDRMLADHGIVGGLHMKEFRQGGKLRGLSLCCRRELFLHAKHLIETYSAQTVAFGIDGSQYRTHLPDVVRERFSLYGLCFHLAAIITHKLCESNNYPDRVPFIMDAGNPYASHVRDAHEFIIKRWQKYFYLHMGGLFFDDDACFGTLQAADVIAWSTRRKMHGKEFPPGFAPLLEMVTKDRPHHIEVMFRDDQLRQLGEELQSGIQRGDHEKEVTDEDIQRI